MNKTFKVVFNKTRGALIATNECTSSVQAKGTKTVVAASLAAVMAAASGIALAADEALQTLWGWDAAQNKLVELTPDANGGVTANGNYYRAIYSNSAEHALAAPELLKNFTLTVDDESLKGEDAKKKPLDAVKAENGGSIAFGSASNRTLDNFSLTIKSAEPIKGRQDIMGLHASGGTIGIYANNDVTIASATADSGNAVMVQNSGDKSGSVVINALGDVKISAVTRSTIVQGAINGTADTNLSITGRNVTVTTDGASKAAYQLYDQKWQSENRVPGVNTATFTALETLTLKSSKLDAVNINRGNATGNATTDQLSFTAPTVKLEGARSAVNVTSTEKSQSNMTIAAENATLTSSTNEVEGQDGTKTTYGTITTTANATVTLTGLNGKTGSFNIENTAKGGNAIQTAGTVVFDQVNAGVTGNVAAENGTLSVKNGSDLHLKGDSTITAHNIKVEEGSTLTYDTTASGALDFGAQTDLGGGQLVASSEFQKNFKTREEAAAATKSVVKEGSGVATDKLEETQIWGETLLNKDGTIAHAYDNVVLTSLKNFSAITAVQWRGEIDRLEQRLGDVRMDNGAVGAWARVYGGNSTADLDGDVDVRTNSIQVGADYALDNWIYGAAFSYTKGTGDFSNGSAESDSYNLAAYATGRFDCGAYVDLVGRVGILKSDFDWVYNNQDLGGFKASADNTAYGLSVQTGWKYDLNSTFFVEPQAHLAYGFIAGDSFSNNGVKIDQDDIQSLTGRLGALFGAHFQDGKGRVFLHASVNHDFLGDADSTATYKTQVADNSVDLGGTWYTYGFGLQMEPVKNLSVYATLDRANGSEYTDEYRYSLGARYTF